MYLEVKDLVKYYGEMENKIKVLKGVNCSIDKGEICVLLGPSGSGKSTLLNILGGIEEFDEGEIIFNGKSLSKMKKGDLSLYRRNNLGFVFQFYNLIPNLTVKENIEVCEYLSKNPINIDELLKNLGLYDHKDKFPNQLSGGQQQRCAIGRALVKNPGILLCDEPTGALDYKTSKEILELIETLNTKYHTTIIIVTHNEAIKNMANKVLKLKDGNIIKSYSNENITKAKDLEW
ncbi:MAG: ABC transporter ATP-binding protein [Clostridiales bacterium]|nr:ABC transporter ATP-binding protein [Clostridiales bacterium]